jgi:predicted phosphodiesterase
LTDADLVAVVAPAAPRRQSSLEDPWSYARGVRAAVFSDVHGNLPALEAVLADAEDHHVDEHWIIGDLVAHGPQPAATLQRLMSLPSARIVRGNTDRYVVTGDISGIIPPLDHPRTDKEIQGLVAATSAHAWTRGCITTVGGYDWLAALPVQHRVVLPNGSRVLLGHGRCPRHRSPRPRWQEVPDDSRDVLHATAWGAISVAGPRVGKGPPI